MRTEERFSPWEITANRVQYLVAVLLFGSPGATRVLNLERVGQVQSLRSSILFLRMSCFTWK